jgi:hypothetical protein
MEGLWIVRGDEEMSEYNFRSRTLDPVWIANGYLRQAPCLFRYDKSPVDNKNDWRVDISPLDTSIRRINNHNDDVVRYLYSPVSGLFNRTGFPMQQYLVMAFNFLKEISVDANYLEFQTLTPASNTGHITRASHPWLVHKWDIITARDKVTIHVNTPKGDVFNFLVSREGRGYIPLEYVRKLS